MGHGIRVGLGLVVGLVYGASREVVDLRRRVAGRAEIEGADWQAVGVELVVGEGEELIVLAYACGVFQVRAVVVAGVAREGRLGTAGSDVGSGAFLPGMTFCG